MMEIGKRYRVRFQHGLHKVKPEPVDAADLTDPANNEFIPDPLDRGPEPPELSVFREPEHDPDDLTDPANNEFIPSPA